MLVLLLRLRLCGRLKAQKGVAPGRVVCVDSVLSFSGSPLQMGHISNVACLVWENEREGGRCAGKTSCGGGKAAKCVG